MKVFKCDLHIHTCLSPCASLEMSPVAIVEESLGRGLDLIAICDHNSAENAGAVIRAGAERGLHVLPGMEINSIEEVHSLAIFDSEKQAAAMQEIVYRHLDGINNPDIFGEQIVANEFDEVEGFNPRMLIGGTGLKLDEIVREVQGLGGLSIASHVDRPSYSIVSQLGFIPPGLDLDAVEVSYRTKIEDLADSIPEIMELPVIRSSDAHFYKDIGRVYTSFFIETPSVNEIRMALWGKRGRRVVN
ncbi:PHP domain-containing protein [Deltaproteobacteria bacterium]|nr:PHP domain-containing protein [Deltaproteobacteria bacterium]